MELSIWNISEFYSTQGVGQRLSQKTQTLLLLRVHWCNIAVEYLHIFIFIQWKEQPGESVQLLAWDFLQMLRNVQITYLVEHANVTVKKISIQNTYIYLHTTLPAHIPANVHIPLLWHSHSDIEALCHDSNVFISMNNSGKGIITTLKVSCVNFHSQIRFIMGQMKMTDKVQKH